MKEATLAVTVDAGQFAGFGPNEWLVYEMYQSYLKDPESVDKAWWDFFADYAPSDPPKNGSSAAPTAPPAAAAAAAPTAAPKAAAAPAAQPTAAPASSPGSSTGTPTTQPTTTAESTAPAGRILKGAAARTVVNMQSSLAVPTATSVRAVP
ncbi:MAG TPA: multifunctional oxoglutarate decarboxylase/oxoglutarate dehydrogenase thiamine pyrophosphate-binding subunit/dihydrolipoyllysine-residue succinyltransferase subunit, partial [Mycobacteriales bacterium]|nr:multifunctional oxoglutarate decarboxylase/oxoglutarate dehydrogenase thiamine pyrophosphate-binding subunit/dihydrolipoyllysine-residue succinyltransferase subunit [Mycobacteriales bacterium]